MRLKVYLEEHGISGAAFARMIGTHQVNVHRYMHGQRFPSPQIIAKIDRATKGKVTVRDWYEQAQEGLCKKESAA
ncbi:helix-turn-helix transcriptional regulator [Chelativorans sp. Marseille-P2723]|uniref:helix-turn-helix domain-containing protein n=1 Tax=Chelativorans sp. Marseille-P2723 TaxID=2709133 RepID=UPI00156ED0DB|nr:helix-turn-helix transcriptional regulator [Chelativorans sp. Marseille-P2723]